MSDKVNRFLPILLFLLILFLVIGAVYLFFDGLALAKGVLAPLFLALILSMMLSPVSSWLENKGINRGLSAALADLLFILFIVGVIWAVGMEVKKLASQGPKIQSRLSSQFQKVESFIEQNSGFSLDNPFNKRKQENSQGENQQQEQQTNNAASKSSGTEQQSSQQSMQGGGNSGNAQQQEEQQSGGILSGSGSGFSMESLITTVASKIFSSLTTILLIAVYIFFMLMYRKKFRRAVLRYIPEDQEQKGKQILTEIIKDARQYLIGNLILVAMLTVIYSIGFFISGMQSPFTIAFLAAVLSLIPYIGNIIGGTIALGLAYITTGNMSTVWIVLATMAVAQFIESYFIEPYLVGKRVKVNPLFTIIAVIIGSAVWGVIGMIVFLPLFSFIKAIADHVPLLHPLGYTIGDADDSA